jgi:uncharacterized surface protein with fasciclin (FAS1) repeats
MPPGGTEVAIEVFIHFDDFPPETAWSITRIATGEIVANVDTGTYELLTDSVTEVVTLLASEEYSFLIEDLFGDGLCCAVPGTYIVRQGSVELVMGGGNFGSSEETLFTTISSGETLPPATSSPVTVVPTVAPVTSSPATPPPTGAPVTPSPTEEPTLLNTAVPTVAPVTPSPATPPPTGAPVTPSPAEEPTLLNIFDTLNGSGEFPTLVEALLVTGLADELEGPGPFTLFAPTEEAFDSLPPGVLDLLLLPENQDTLTEILLYHVVFGAILSGDITDGSQAETLGGSNVTFSVDEGQIDVDDATIKVEDVLASNGVIHVIDEVLIPDGLVLPKPSPMPTDVPVGAPTEIPVQVPTTPTPTRSPFPEPSLSPSKEAPSLDYPLETLPPTMESQSRDFPESPTSFPNNGQSNTLSTGGIIMLHLDLIFEDAPEAIGWSVRNTRTDIVVAHRPVGPVPTFHPNLYETISLLWGEHYEFFLEEADGDCCTVPVSYKVSWEDYVIVEGEVSAGDEVRTTFSLTNTSAETVPQEDYTIYDASTTSDGGIIVGLQLDLVFLEHPEEIGWSVRNTETGNIVNFRAILPLATNQLDLHETISLLRGQTYEFVLEEADGNCCSVSVSYKLSDGDSVIVEGEIHAGDEVRATFSLVNPAAETVAHQSTSTFAPLEIGSATTSGGGIIVDIVLDLVFYGGPEQLGWHLQNSVTLNVLASGPIGGFSSDQASFQKTIALLRGQTYDFVLEEENGLCCTIPVSYTILRGGTVIIDEDAGSGEVVQSTFVLD